MLKTNLSTSEVFCCGECHAAVALVFQAGGDLTYECQSPACGKTVSSDCVEGLAVIDDIAITLDTPASAPQLDELPPLTVLATAAADLVLGAADAGNTPRVNALNKAAQALHDGVRLTRTAGGYLICSGSRAGIIHRVSAGRCTCEAARSGKACYHACLIEIITDAQARVLPVPAPDTWAERYDRWHARIAA